MYFQRKFKDLLSIIGFDGGKDSTDNESTPLTLNEERLEKTRVERTKMSVKKMHRKSKMDSAFRGRQKIQNLFARRGVYLNI